jgi:hypothetical protein
MVTFNIMFLNMMHDKDVCCFQVLHYLEQVMWSVRVAAIFWSCVGNISDGCQEEISDCGGNRAGISKEGIVRCSRYSRDWWIVKKVCMWTKHLQGSRTCSNSHN